MLNMAAQADSRPIAKNVSLSAMRISLSAGLLGSDGCSYPKPQARGEQTRSVRVRRTMRLAAKAGIPEWESGVGTYKAGPL